MKCSLHAPEGSLGYFVCLELHLPVGELAHSADALYLFFVLIGETISDMLLTVCQAHIKGGRGLALRGRCSSLGLGSFIVTDLFPACPVGGGRCRCSRNCRGGWLGGQWLGLGDGRNR